MMMLKLGLLQTTKLAYTAVTIGPRSYAISKRAFSATTECTEGGKAGRGGQSASPLAPLGVTAALEAADGEAPRAKIFDEFSLHDRVGLVSGGNRGLGLEMAMALAEAGARAVYCVDLATQPSNEWKAVRDYLGRMNVEGGKAPRLEYVSADVRDQAGMWQIGQDIGDKEKRMDFCVAAAGILKTHTDCLEYPAKQFQEVMDVNTNGVLYTVQAAGRQMSRFGRGGSIVLIASMSGSITNRDHAWVSYNTSKSAVLQMTRSMACELGPKRIRVNSLSPGHIYTRRVVLFLIFFIRMRLKGEA
ncbi:hypothetical protein HGRIS_013286 [Hohenbuehelia grisea]|uniref:Sorbose reductase sou1 n=1 Tax=Hohenbuehelia grisea TaxID=104357 RepID=A0ABR3IV79_9AGAR